jgi:DNA polymerase-3 subunit alpha (Gram-positive type)
MSKNLDEIEFTIFDTETTGLEPEAGDRIVEIAGIRFKGQKNLATFQTLVNPGRPISEAAFEVNRITQDMLRDAPFIGEVLPKFLDFIKDSCLCSYNAAFDLGFLNNELRLAGNKPLENIAVVDILKMAKRLLPDLERYALWFVADKLGIKTEQKHRALCDVELTLDVFNKFNAILKTKGIWDFLNFSSLFGINSHFLDNINNQKIAKIQEAIGLGVKLKIKYLSSSRAEVSERDVIPKEIKQDRHHSYLIGYCCLRNEERTFRIDGILHLEII